MLASAVSGGQSVQPRLVLHLHDPRPSSVASGCLEPDVTSSGRKGEEDSGVVTSSQDGGERVKKL